TREQACARFASSPPELVPGIGPKTAARLAALGLRTLAALAAAPRELLIARFGPNMGRELVRRARFEHGGEVGSPHKVASESRGRPERGRRERRRGRARARRAGAAGPFRGARAPARAAGLARAARILAWPRSGWARSCSTASAAAPVRPCS